MAAETKAPHPLLGEDTEEPAGLPAPEETILRLRQAILAGEHWFSALLDAVGRWRVAQEVVRGREYRYLAGGEAFDWLLLAERLLDELEDLVPARERDDLVLHGRWPIDLDDDEFIERIGPAKHSAHLNYLYGVLVEEALQLHVEEEIHKESRARVWGQDVRVDETMFERVYGKSRAEMTALYYEQTKTLIGSSLSYADLKDFTYWLFTYRLRTHEKARVASDTRKGLAQLTRMELAVSERRRGARLGEDAFFEQFAVAG